MSPAAIDATMKVDPEGYVSAQHQHNDDHQKELPGQMSLIEEPAVVHVTVTDTATGAKLGEWTTDERGTHTPIDAAEADAILAPDPVVSHETGIDETTGNMTISTTFLVQPDLSAQAAEIAASEPQPYSGTGGIMVVTLNMADDAALKRVLWAAGLNPETVKALHLFAAEKPNKKNMIVCAQQLAQTLVNEVPDVIVIFGTDLLKAVTNEQKITLAHGKRASFNDAFRLALGELIPNHYDPFIMPAQSPSSIEHSPKGPQLEVQIVEDLRMATAQAEGTFVEIPVPWIWETKPVAQLKQATNATPDIEKAVWSADIETNGLPTWHPNFRIGMIAIDTGYDPVGVFRGKDVLNGIELLRFVMEKGTTVVGHNWSGFDRVGIQNRTKINLRGDDTMLLAHLLNEERGKGLETWATAELGVRPWKDELPENCWARMTAGDFTEEEWNRLGLYCARDTRYDRLLFLKQMEMIAPDFELFKYYKTFFLPFSRALAAIEQRGIYIDQEKIQNAWGKYELQKLRGETACRMLTGIVDFNPGSWQQVGKVLFDDLRLPAQQWTKEGEESTNEFSLKTLKYLVETDPIYHATPQVPALVNAILDYRQAVKYEGTYLRPYARIALSSPITSRGFPQYSLVRSVSRTSSNGGEKDDPNNFGFNTQNRPRDLDIVGAAPGYVIVHADASQLELRTIAQCSMSKPMIDALNEGKDLHAELAMAIRKLRGDAHPENFTPEERNRAKPGNFGFGYGADEYTFEVIALKDYDMVIPRQESTLIRNAFHARWQLRPWYERQMKEASDTGQVRSLSGRVRRLPNINSSDPKTRLEALRQAINFPAQELGLTIWGCCLILAVGMGLPVVQEIHDSMDIEVLPEQVEETIAKVKAIEHQIPAVLKNLFGFDLVVPFKIDVKVA